MVVVMMFLTFCKAIWQEHFSLHYCCFIKPGIIDDSQDGSFTTAFLRLHSSQNLESFSQTFIILTPQSLCFSREEVRNVLSKNGYLVVKTFHEDERVLDLNPISVLRKLYLYLPLPQPVVQQNLEFLILKCLTTTRKR